MAVRYRETAKYLYFTYVVERDTVEFEVYLGLPHSIRINRGTMLLFVI